MMNMQDGPAARRIARLLVFPILMLTIMIGTYIPAMRAPQPHDLPIAIVGADAAIVAAYQQELGDRFDLVELPDAATARQQVEDGTVGAALVLTATDQDRGAGTAYQSIAAPAADQVATAAVAYVATAGGASLASGSLLPLQTLATNLGTPLVARDLVSLDSGDSAGIGAMFFTMAVTLAGFISVTTLSSMAPQMLRVKPMVISLAVFGAIVSTWVWALTHLVLGVINGPALLLILTGTLTVMAAGLAASVFTRLMGPLAVLISMFLFVALGMSASGVAIPFHFLPGFYQIAHKILTFPATSGAVKSLMYYDGDGLLSYWIVLVSWIVIASAALELVNRWKDRQPAEHETHREPTLATAEASA